MPRREPQLDLALQEMHRWGGRRPGAGRPVGLNPRMAHRSRTTFGRGHPCHVTIRVRDDVPNLRKKMFVHELERSFASACERGEFRLVHYAILGNHAHLLVEAKDRHALGRGMKSLGARFSRTVNRVFRRSGAVLSDRYHVSVLKTPTQVRNALRYVLLNARHHAKRARKVVERLDPASSGRFFDGWRWRPAADGPRAYPLTDAPVARPHTWLLTKGWRRRGLIDPAEVPGAL
jgi:REP element-mobilizing transposase RayT